MTNFEVLWDVKTKAIFDVTYAKEYDVALVRHNDLRRITAICLKSRKELWTHQLGRYCVIKNFHVWGKWLLVRYGGKENQRLCFDIETGEFHQMEEELSTARVIYSLDNYLVFSLDREKGYMTFCSESGRVSELAGDDVVNGTLPCAFGGDGKRYYGWEEEEGETSWVMGNVDQSTGFPTVDGVRALPPGGEEGSFSIPVFFRDDYYLGLIHGKSGRYGWFDIEGKLKTEFVMPEEVWLEWPVCDIFFHTGKNGESIVFCHKLNPKKFAVACSYSLVTGELMWKHNFVYVAGQFTILGDYLIYTIGERAPESEYESRQIDLDTGEIQPFLNEPIEAWVCKVENGLLFNRVDKGRGCLAYGEFVD